MAVREISPKVAPVTVMHEVYNRNRDSIWALYESADHHRERPEMVGMWCYLPLSAEGVEALYAGKFDPGAPDLSMLVPSGTTPGGLYLWAVVCPGRLLELCTLLTYAMGEEIYGNFPTYGTIGTERGRRALAKRETEKNEGTIGSIFRSELTPEIAEGYKAFEIYPGNRPNAPRAPKDMEIRVVANAEDMARAMAIRSAVFMTEQDCPYEEEFDGNDFAATHLLATINGEPAATLRLRFFADFAKVERLAALPRFRRSNVAHAIVRHGIEVCRRKGYRTLYGHAQTRLTRFWSRFGFRPLHTGGQGDETFVFSDHEYVEMVAQVEAHPAAIRIGSDPLVIIRPEGEWDQAGVLDRSAERPARNPH